MFLDSIRLQTIINWYKTKKLFSLSIVVVIRILLVCCFLFKCVSNIDTCLVTLEKKETIISHWSGQVFDRLFEARMMIDNYLMTSYGQSALVQCNVRDKSIVADAFSKNSSLVRLEFDCWLNCFPYSQSDSLDVHSLIGYFHRTPKCERLIPIAVIVKFTGIGQRKRKRRSFLKNDYENNWKLYSHILLITCLCLQ